MWPEQLAAAWISEYHFWDTSIFSESPMPLYIKDDAIARSVAEFAKGRVEAGSGQTGSPGRVGPRRRSVPLRDRFAALRKAHKLPPPAGNVADNAFFDELSGEL
jgi:antitoxin VapB